MTEQKIDITPQTKIGELLEAYPELEELLISIAPPFKKLTNPVLRRTVAKVTSIAQAARVGSVEVGEMVNTLRKAAGLSLAGANGESNDSISATVSADRPDWFKKAKLAKTIDVIPIIEAGEQPVGIVLSALKDLVSGEMLELITPFEPAPLIDQAKAKGFVVWTEKSSEGLFMSFFKQG